MCCATSGEPVKTAPGYLSKQIKQTNQSRKTLH
jgi:hypothetical protein